MGFLNPNASFFSLLFVVLIALYLWERYRRRVDVPSLLLWQTVPDTVVRASRFKPDLLFLLRLLLLALLIGGLTNPYLSENPARPGGSRYVFVLDISASMQAREGKQTRFEQARESLRKRIAALATDDQAMLITAANQPRVMAALSHDHAALLARLAELQPVDMGGDINLAFAIAQRAAESANGPAHIEVFTDAPQSELSTEWRDQVGMFQFGETDDNLAIESLQIHQGRFQDYHDAYVHVVVRNFSYREAHGVLTLELENQILRRQGFSLAPRSKRGFPVRHIPRPGIFHATLDVEDALTADNDAYGWLRPPQVIRVLVVSEPSLLKADLERISERTPNPEFRFLDPSDYQAGLSLSADIVLFHRFVPETEPRSATLFIFPSRGNDLFTVQGEATQLDILDWNQGHPALQGIRPQVPLPLTRAQVLELPSWMSVLLTSRSGGREIPLAFAGSRAGNRIAGISFDLIGEHMLSADHLDLLLIFLNLLQWLAPSNDAVTILRTGDVHLVADLPRKPRRVLDPHSQLSISPPGTPLFLEPLYVGEYLISANGTRRRVFANFFDASESDIGRPTKVPFSAPKREKATTWRPGAEAGFGTWLYAVAAVLFLLEWAAAARES